MPFNSTPDYVHKGPRVAKIRFKHEPDKSHSFALVKTLVLVPTKAILPRRNEDIRDVRLGQVELGVLNGTHAAARSGSIPCAIYHNKYPEDQPLAGALEDLAGLAPHDMPPVPGGVNSSKAS